MVTRNYDPLRRLIESRMLDAGTLTRDAQGTDDDTLDQNTGALTPPGGDTTNVYTGKALVYPTALTQRVDSEGARAYTEKTYTLRLPWDAAEPKPGDVWTMSASAHDATLVGRPLRVLAVDRSSFLTSRDMVVEDRSSP